MTTMTETSLDSNGAFGFGASSSQPAVVKTEPLTQTPKRSDASVSTSKKARKNTTDRKNNGESALESLRPTPKKTKRTRHTAGGPKKKKKAPVNKKLGLTERANQLAKEWGQSPDSDDDDDDGSSGDERMSRSTSSMSVSNSAASSYTSSASSASSSSDEQVAEEDEPETEEPQSASQEDDVRPNGRPPRRAASKKKKPQQQKKQQKAHSNDDEDSMDEEGGGGAGGMGAAVRRMQIPAPIPMIPIARHGKPLLFNDDEGYTLDDNIVRRTIYRQIPSYDMLRNAKSIVCINFTRAHFVAGATQWYHLKSHYFDLFCSLMKSLGYSVGNQMKNTPPPKVPPPEANKGRRGKNGGGGGDQGDRNDMLSDGNSNRNKQDASPQEKESQFIQGKDDICVFFETLFSHGSRVAGYRVWIINRGVSKVGTDYLSLGNNESLIEATTLRSMATHQLATVGKVMSQQRTVKGKKTQPRQYQLAKEFHFVDYPTFDRHFLGILKPYFSSDPAFVLDPVLYAQDQQLDMDVEGEGNNAQQQRQKKKKPAARGPMFIDSRPFVTYDALGVSIDSNGARRGGIKDYTLIQHPCNISSLFSKEAAMHYYVLDEGVNAQQCQLSSYFRNAPVMHYTFGEANENPEQDNAASAHMNVEIGDMGMFERAEHEMHVEDEEEERHIQRRNRPRIPVFSDAGQAPVVADSEFEDFPYANTTYYVDNLFLGHEFMVRMPLPHRLGSTLYTGRDEFTMNQHAGILGENEFEPEFPNEVMGLHETELELTSELLLSQQRHLDERSLNYLKHALIPKPVLQKFVHNKSNEISTRLKLILTNQSSKGRIVISERIDEQHRKPKRIELPDCHTNILNCNSHQLPDNWDTCHREPYISRTEPGLINNIQKGTQLKRKALEYRRRNNTLDEADKKELGQFAKREYESRVASGNLGHHKEIIERFRPFGNSMEVIRTQLHRSREDDVSLSRDVFMRLAALNKEAWANFDSEFIDPETGEVYKDREEECAETRNKLVNGLVVEVWDEFFKSPDVSMAVEGVREDLLRQHKAYTAPNNNVEKASTEAGRRTVGRPLPVHEYRHDLRPYAAYRVWIHGFIADQGGITYNYKTISILYFSKFHHCRWFPQCNNPKLNIILSGSGMAGKSRALQLIKWTCPSSVGDMVTHITDQAFNVDRPLNDMLLIYEEFQNKYLGYPSGGGSNNRSSNGGGGGGGVSHGDSKDTTNFFKARLTCGKTTTFSWFENEETGKRDMKISQAHCQGNLLGATNNDLSEADMNVLSRLILISVPKSRHAIEGLRPQDRDKLIVGEDVGGNSEMVEEHKELHRVYVLMEQIFKSNVIGDDVFGVNVDGARIMTTMILDQLEQKYGIPTNDVRKRNHVLELARCMALSYACWMGLTSSLTRYLQYDPHYPEHDAETPVNAPEPRFIGFNPRVITEGILPYCVVTKDQVFDSVTALSCLWYHEYQELILDIFATKKCNLPALKQSDFLYRRKQGSGGGGGGGGGGGNSATANDRNAGYGGSVAAGEGSNSGYGQRASNGGGEKEEIPKEIDYNYIKLSGKNLMEIAEGLSMSLGELVVAPQDILKLFTDLSRSWIQDVDSYELSMVMVNGQLKPRLVRSRDPTKNRQNRRLIDFSYCQDTQKPTISILVHFLKQKLPHIFKDDIIENLDVNDQQQQPQQAAPVVQGQQPQAPQNANQAADGDMDVDEEEEDKACDDSMKEHYYKTIRELGRIDRRNESLIVKAIKDVMENGVLEYTGLSPEKEKELRDSYRNPLTGSVPWESYITADPPKPAKLTKFCPEMGATIGRTKTGDRDILFVDKLMMMPIKRRAGKDPMILHNYNTISASTKNTLSIYSKRSKKRDRRALNESADDFEARVSSTGRHTRREAPRKRRVNEYAETDAWEIDKDIDFIFCNEHLRNIGFQGLKTAADYSTINYPPSTYMALVDHKRAIDEYEGEESEPLMEYPFFDNMKHVEKRKKRIENQLDPTRVTYPKLGNFVASNYSEGGKTRRSCTDGDGIMLGKPVVRSLDTERARLKKCYAMPQRQAPPPQVMVIDPPAQPQVPPSQKTHKRQKRV